MLRRLFLRTVLMAPVALPALLKMPHDRPSALWVASKFDRVYKMVQQIDGRRFFSIEAVKRIGPGLERYHRLVSERTLFGRERLVEEVTWTVHKGVTVEGSTRYLTGRR